MTPSRFAELGTTTPFCTSMTRTAVFGRSGRFVMASTIWDAADHSEHYGDPMSEPVSAPTSGDYVIRAIRPEDWPRVKQLRLDALRDPVAHLAFLETYEEAA